MSSYRPHNPVGNRTTARATPTRIASAAIPARLRRNGPGSGFARRCAHGERATALRRPPTTGRAPTRAGAAAKRSNDYRPENGPRRPLLRICTGAGRRPSPTPSAAPEGSGVNPVDIRTCACAWPSVNGAPKVAVNASAVRPARHALPRDDRRPRVRGGATARTLQATSARQPRASGSWWSNAVGAFECDQRHRRRPTACLLLSEVSRLSAVRLVAASAAEQRPRRPSGGGRFAARACQLSRSWQAVRSPCLWRIARRDQRRGGALRSLCDARVGTSSSRAAALGLPVGGEAAPRSERRGCAGLPLASGESFGVRVRLDVFWAACGVAAAVWRDVRG